MKFSPPPPRWEHNQHSDGSITFLPHGTSLEGMIDVSLVSDWPYRTYVGINDTRRYNCREFHNQYQKENHHGNSTTP